MRPFGYHLPLDVVAAIGVGVSGTLVDLLVGRPQGGGHRVRDADAEASPTMSAAIVRAIQALRALS